MQLDLNINSNTKKIEISKDLINFPKENVTGTISVPSKNENENNGTKNDLLVFLLLKMLETGFHPLDRIRSGWRLQLVRQLSDFHCCNRTEFLLPATITKNNKEKKNRYEHETTEILENRVFYLKKRLDHLNSFFSPSIASSNEAFAITFVCN